MQTAPTLGFILHDVARLMRKRFEQKARDLGLTRAQWQILSALARNEGAHQRLLAELLEIEPITVGRILDRLQALELIERRPHPTDRRIKILHLMPGAAPVLAEMRKLGEATRAEALAGLSQADRDRLTAVLTVMRTNLIAACDGGAEEPKREDG